MTEHINITNLSSTEILDYLRKWYTYNKPIYDATGDDILYLSKLRNMTAQEKEERFKKMQKHFENIDKLNETFDNIFE